MLTIRVPSLFLALALATVATACVTPNPAFVCENAAQCGGDGTCEATGYCAFPDAACNSGRRYGDSAGNGLAGACVGQTTPTPDGGDPDVDADPNDPDAAIPDIDAAIPDIDASLLCGNGDLDVGEDCDDGNGADDDLCVGCQLARCGDSATRAGVEDCDDGNLEDGDTCASNCLACDAGADASTVFGGHCFARFDTPEASWDEARDRCRDLRGHLATYASAGERDAGGGLLVAGTFYWIGLSDEANEDDFVWEDDSALGFESWAPGRPDGDFGENCAAQSVTTGNWDDRDCGDNDTPYLCERDPWTLEPTTNHAYLYLGGADRTTFAAAQATCVALGGGAHLVTVTDAAEQAFVADLARDEVWIGLSDTVIEDTFVWVDGGPFDFENWLGGGPSPGGPTSDCVNMRTDGLWDDQPCNVSEAFICEID